MRFSLWLRSPMVEYVKRNDAITVPGYGSANPELSLKQTKNVAAERPPISGSVQPRADPGEDAIIRLGLDAVVLVDDRHADGDEAREAVEAHAHAG
jgi:hypothetical protein